VPSLLVSIAILVLLAAAGVGGTHGPRPGGGNDDFFGLAALVFGAVAAIMVVSAIAGSYVGGRFDRDPPPPPAAPPAAAPPAEPVAPAIPDGAGIVSEVINGRPKVSVYFDVGKSDIAPDFAAAVAPVKAWLDANPDDRVQLSGFSDPTGNAAANAELAKNRAQAVAAQLNAEGVAGERIDLVKPEDSSDEAADLAGARRVEITVTPG
jgi:outer membrane protein OmpA-like peptidoglycan-associated protein